MNNTRKSTGQRRATAKLELCLEGLGKVCGTWEVWCLEVMDVSNDQSLIETDAALMWRDSEQHGQTAGNRDSRTVSGMPWHCMWDLRKCGARPR
jgi:hypothetical protein